MDVWKVLLFNTSGRKQYEHDTFVKVSYTKVSYTTISYKINESMSKNQAELDRVRNFDTCFCVIFDH